jgi:hypothetical protein
VVSSEQLATTAIRVSTAPHHRPAAAPRKLSVAERRARLVVQCACEMQGIDPATVVHELHLPISVAEFEQALRARYAHSHPNLIYRTDSTLERARLERSRLPDVPRVILRRGAPPRPR